MADAMTFGAAPVSMKLTAADKKADKGSLCGPCDVSEPDYPWGLRLRLTERELEKLGIEALPQVGEALGVVGVGKVVEVYASDNGGGKRRGFEIVLTDLALAPKTAPRSAADVLYGASKET